MAWFLNEDLVRDVEEAITKAVSEAENNSGEVIIGDDMSSGRDETVYVYLDSHGNILL